MAMDWNALLACITGSVDQELRLRNEYLGTENRILCHQSTGRIHLSDGERKTLAAIGKKLGKQALKEGASMVTPDTLLNQGQGNVVLLPMAECSPPCESPIACQERLGGLLKYYYRAAV